MLEITNYNCGIQKLIPPNFHDNPLTIIINGFNTSYPFHRCEFNMKINGTFHVYNNIRTHGGEIISREIIYPVTEPIKIHFENQNGNNMTFNLNFYDHDYNIIKDMDWSFDLHYRSENINICILSMKKPNGTGKSWHNDYIKKIFPDENFLVESGCYLNRKIEIEGFTTNLNIYCPGNIIIPESHCSHMSQIEKNMQDVLSHENQNGYGPTNVIIVLLHSMTNISQHIVDTLRINRNLLRFLVISDDKKSDKKSENEKSFEDISSQISESESDKEKWLLPIKDLCKIFLYS